MDLADAYGSWGRPEATKTPKMYDEATVKQIVEQAVHGMYDRVRNMIAHEIRNHNVQVGAVAAPAPTVEQAPRAIVREKSHDVEKMWLAGVNVALILLLGILGIVFVATSKNQVMYHPLSYRLP
jgi:hypothetical protein